MTYRTILVQLDVDAPAAPRLSFAIDLARRFEASVIAFAAAEAHLYVPHDESGMVASELLKRQTAEIEERLAALKEEFLSAVGEQEHLSWRGLVGNPMELLAANARAADLVVTGLAAGGASGDRHRTVDPGSLVLTAGRPVFIASETLTPVRAETVVVAWKDAREARRAVLDAIPFLVGAKEVLVVTIEEGEQKAARESAGDVVRFLMRHGARARADVLGVGNSDVGDAMSEIARETGADLIVAGGYGHSRLREWAFGGVTRSLLADGSVHRLISN